MVDGFTKDGTFRPINRSPVSPPQSLTVRELLPKGQTQELKQKQIDRNQKFANDRKEKKEKEVEESRKKRAFRGGVSGARKVGRGLRFGKEKIQQSRIEKSIREREFSERIDADIDRILDDPNSSDSRKFRLLVRFATLNRKNLTKEQAKFINRTNIELATRIKEDRKSSGGLSSGVGSGTGSGITEEQLNKLPQEVQADVKQAVA